MRRLLDILIAENKKPLSGKDWTTAKLSNLLKNPIYVKTNSDVYDYYERHGVQMITDVSMFTGEYGAQLYGHSKHKNGESGLVRYEIGFFNSLRHRGFDIWLKCQRKLVANKQIGNSISNRTSWLFGKIICEKCGHTMTTVKGKINKEGEIRRYFNCTGKSHKKTCTGPKVSIYAEDLENMVYDCISEKLSDLRDTKNTAKINSAARVNNLKLKLKTIEKTEKQLLDTMLTGGYNEDLLTIANQKATQYKKDRLVLNERIDELSGKSDDTEVVVNLVKSWGKADYSRKKEVATIMINKIIISEEGSTKIMWNI